MIETLNKLFSGIERLPVWSLTVLVSLVIGFTLKKTKRFPNDMIPIGVLLLGTCASVAIRYGFGRFIVEGLVYSGTAWMFHKFIWKNVVKVFIARFPVAEATVKEIEKEFDTDPGLKRITTTETKTTVKVTDKPKD